MLVAAQNPVILADRACRSQEGMKRMVELAEALNAPVMDIGGRMNFPMNHYLCRSGDRRSLIGQADVALLLEVADPWGQFNTVSDPHHEYRRLAKPDVKSHSHLPRRYAHESPTTKICSGSCRRICRFPAMPKRRLPALIEAVKRPQVRHSAQRSRTARPSCGTIIAG